MPVEVTWWGHATASVRDSGVTVLTDPLLVRRMAHLRRRRGELPPASATVADVVLVSHLHADHLHLGSLSRLAPHTRVLVPRGALRALPGLRRLASLLCVEEVAAGDTVTVSSRTGETNEIGAGGQGGQVTVRAVRAAHDGRRMPYGPHHAPALGYVVEGAARTYFAGDTGLFEGMAEAVGPVDVALLPVGGWGPWLGEEHLDAGRAAQALVRLRPRYAVPVHYGTYWPIGMDAVRPHEFHAPGDEFVRKAGLMAPDVAVHRLGHGESIRLEMA
ncbi:MAG TPA: MBL fold metallo-hydrolase [Streptomyces sp.]|nr:MBL fold metallo-hydrolase [Streptomyces sp.]